MREPRIGPLQWPPFRCAMRSVSTRAGPRFDSRRHLSSAQRQEPHFRAGRMRLVLLGLSSCRRVVPAAGVCPMCGDTNQGPGPGTSAVAGVEEFTGGESPAGEMPFPVAFSASSRALYTSGRN